MQYMKLGSSGIEVSRVCFGAWEVGGGTAWESAGDAVTPILDALPEMGVNFIDTAKVYGTGRSEELLGAALQGRREKFILTSKGGMNWRDGSGERFWYDRDGVSVYQNTSAKALRLDLEESLTRLRTDYLDVYFTHRQPITVPIEETMGALMAFKKEGKIRAIGISNASAAHLEEYMKYGTVDVVQEKFSLLDVGEVRRYQQFCAAHNVTFQCYSVLERGILTDTFDRSVTVKPGQGAFGMAWYAPERREAVMGLLDELKKIAAAHAACVPAVAMAYALQQGAHINALCGSRSAAHFANSAGGAQIALTQEELIRIDGIVDAMHKEFDHV